MRFSLIIIVLLFCLGTRGASFPLYAGSNSNEVILNYRYFVEMGGGLNPPSEAAAKMVISKQITHLFGSLSNSYPVGSPKMEHEFKITSIEKVSDSNYRANYQYIGKVVLNHTDMNKLRFALPRDPLTIYNRGCTDSHYWQEEYFWYFWDPKMPTCPLKEGKDYDYVTGRIEHLENTKETYPQYKDLFDSGNMRIDILMGMDNESMSRNPFNSKDLAALNYRNLHRSLLALGFKTQSQEDLSNGYLQILNKQTPRGGIEIRFFFGPSSLSGDSFHILYKNALEEANVVIYDGHSGLGEYLDLKKIERQLGERINFDANLYQIYFMNGCSSYPYYNNQYFDRKGGSQNLEIITNGLATTFTAINPSTEHLIRMFNHWAMTGERTSYQDYVEMADSGNLIGVNGDEDESNL